MLPMATGVGRAGSVTKASGTSLAAVSQEKQVRGMGPGRNTQKRQVDARSHLSRSLRAGFTLMEMLLVVLIIAALAAMIVPRLIPQAEEAKTKIAQAEVNASVPAALDLFFLNVGRYPSTEEGLEALWVRPPDVPAENWHGPYIKRRSVLDPWGNPIRYYCPPQRGGLDYDLISAGPDGIENTDDDITNADQED